MLVATYMSLALVEAPSSSGAYVGRAMGREIMIGRAIEGHQPNMTRWYVALLSSSACRKSEEM